jgi:hypothetical protein
MKQKWVISNGPVFQFGPFRRSCPKVGGFWSHVWGEAKGKHLTLLHFYRDPTHFRHIFSAIRYCFSPLKASRMDAPLPPPPPPVPGEFKQANHNQSTSMAPSHPPPPPTLSSSPPKSWKSNTQAPAEAVPDFIYSAFQNFTLKDIGNSYFVLLPYKY